MSHRCWQRGQLWTAPIAGLTIRADADRATYVGRIVFQVLPVVKRDAALGFEVVNAEEHDRAGIANYLGSIQLPFDTRMMGEAVGGTSWTGPISPAAARAPPRHGC